MSLFAELVTGPLLSVGLRNRRLHRTTSDAALPWRRGPVDPRVSAKGVRYTVLLVLLSWPIGIWAVRSQGRAVWQRLTDGIAAGTPPARAVLDGALVLIGGILFILPGFISDLFGALLLVAPSRAAV